MTCALFHILLAHSNTSTIYIYPPPITPIAPNQQRICVYVYNTNLSAYENKRKRKKKYEKQSLMESLEYLFRQRYNTWNILILTKLLLLLLLHVV